MKMAAFLLAPTLIAWVPQDFRTTAHFSVDDRVLRLQAAAAILEQTAGRTWIHVYFYSFPFTPADVSAIAGGSVAALERKWNAGPDPNHSRAVVHMLVDKSWKLSNVALEVPGLTCTIVEDPARSKRAVQSFVTDGSRVQLKAKSSTICDLTSVGGRRQRMTWNVDVSLPIFKKGG